MKINCRVRLQDTRGFTLFEIVMVLMIIGILIMIAVPNLSKAREKGRDARRKSDIKQIQAALEMYRADYGKYPTSNVSKQIVGCTDGLTPCTWGNVWLRNPNTIYMQVLPDNMGPNDYYYISADGISYRLGSCLEYEDDPEKQAVITGVGEFCETISTVKYEVTSP